jgi:hypothetical protein
MKISKEFTVVVERTHANIEENNSVYMRYLED